MMRVVDLDQQLPQEIVVRLTAAPRPTRVTVFGSVASTTADTDSDIDLLVFDLPRVAAARGDRDVRLRAIS
jgi:predicted nucleotidyltransferase